MPIIGLMSESENVFGGLPRIAKLRKGAPKELKTRKDGSTYEVVGRDLDHLRVAFDPEYEHLRSTFTKIYGKQPNNIAAFVNADTVHEAFDFWKEEWTATTMLRRCDGQNKHVWYNQQTGFYQNAKVLCDSSKGGAGCGCKAVGRLNVILPEFTMETGVMGYFTIETHSEEDIRTLYARIVSIWATFGKLRGVPLIFYRVPRKMSVPEIGSDKERTGKRMGKTMHMLDCRVEPEYTKEFLLPAIQQQRSQLPAPPVSTIAAVPEWKRSAEVMGSGGNRRLVELPATVEQPINGNGAHAEPVTTVEEPTTEPEPKWHTIESNMHDITERAFTAGYIKERNGKGRAELETLIAPKTWNDFASGAAAGLAIKDIGEAAKAAKAASKIKPPEPELTGEALALVNGNGKSPFASDSVGDAIHAGKLEETDGKTIPTTEEMDAQFDRAYQLDGA